MSEPRKNHLNIDGGQVKEDEHIATYKPIPESETEPPTKTLSKSREKVSSDGAEEKLLQKEVEARVTTRVNMADAKYVVGDHRNGDAQIELDANKRFAGLTKEELMKFADDPFWVRVRWLMFVAFWLLWLCMLAGAIAIIYTAPKCARPPAKMWHEKGPLADATPATAANLATYADVMLQNLQQINTQGVVVAYKDAYNVLEDPSALDQVKALVVKAKDYGVRVIVELTGSFVSSEHNWFKQALNRTPPYDKFFVFTDGAGAADETGRPKPPNWVSQLNTPAFTWREERRQYYYHQLGEDSPQLDFNNPAVVKQFDEVLKKFMQAGVAGVRLLNARELVVNSTLPDELPLTGQGVDRSAVHTDHRYWQHKHSSDQAQLDELLTHWSHIVDSNALVDPGTGNTVFTISEDGSRPELFLLRRSAPLRPPAAAPFSIGGDSAAAAAAGLEKRLLSWPALKLTKADGSSDLETAAFSMLLPASPVLPVEDFRDNETISHEALSQLGKLAALRQDASIEHGRYSVVSAPAAADNSTGEGSLLVCARWKAGHTGYAALWNAGAAPLHANLTEVASVASRVTLHYASPAVYQLLTRTHKDFPSDKVFVPAESTVVISYVPHTKETKEN